MQVLRRFDDIATKPGTHSPEFMANVENCAVVKGGIPAGTVADPLHKHRFDQFYFILSGATEVQLGTDTLRAPVDTLIRIPAGVPHFAFNDGADDVVQIEILLPAPVPATGGEVIPIKELCADPGGPPPDGCLTALRGDRWVAVPGSPLEVQMLANRSTGSEHGMIGAARVAPSAPSPGYRLHPFDEFYFILDGSLTVDVAGEVHTATRHDLIVVPARTPYRAWNAGDHLERHLTIVTPEPPQSVGLGAWSIPVEFTRPSPPPDHAC
jgi:mannose-6-phosphate isomerase-like protein (cupin superfamily)